MPAEFDPHAGRYDQILAESLRTTGDVDRFSAYKIDEVAYRLDVGSVRKVLDFGCGVGRSLPFLGLAFPHADIWGYDPSRECVDAARQRSPTARVTSEWSEIPADTFDCVLAANVFHHVPAVERLAVLQRCAGALATEGSLFVFEHNPLNPVTRRVFERCPFDRDATMIRRPDMAALGLRAGLEVRRKAFTLFVPFSGRIPALLHRTLAWLPLGAQYYVQFVR
jgi:2-polyprenyl-3-methyl-5-hydroxy-6-metoxy-1,4-benzoquinol methylase